MAKTDSKEYEYVPPVAGFTPAQLKEIAALLRGDDDETLKKRAQFEAEAHQKLTKRENETHPGISVFNPLGERDHPNPTLKCKMYWCGYDLQAEQLTRVEIELLNQAIPGEFSFTRTDGSPERLTITGTKNPDGSFEKLEFLFASKGDNRHNLPSMAAMLRQCIAGQPSEKELADENATLRALLEAATAPA